MRRFALLLILPAVSLAGCNVSKGSGGDNVSMSTDDNGQISMNLPFAKANVKLPGVRLAQGRVRHRRREADARLDHARVQHGCRRQGRDDPRRLRCAEVAGRGPRVLPRPVQAKGRTRRRNPGTRSPARRRKATRSSLPWSLRGRPQPERSRSSRRTDIRQAKGRKFPPGPRKCRDAIPLPASRRRPSAWRRLSPSALRLPSPWRPWAPPA